MNLTGPLRLTSLKCQAVYFGDVAFSVPSFLIDSFNLVYHSLKSEGLFRKSSNASRMKNLKYPFSGEFGIPEGLTVHDICFLIKQFFRKIQEPLLTYELEPQFFKFRSMQHEPTQVRYILELCHVLPPIHRETLAFLMRKLKHITDFSEYNKMDANNLATVLAPSILRCHCEKSDIVRLLEKEVESGQLSFQKKDAEIKCLLIRILIENAENIGILTLYEKVMSPDMYDNLLPEDHNCMIYGNGNKNLWRVNNKKKNGRQAESSNLKYVLTPSRGSQRKVIANQKRLNMKSNDSSIVVSETNDKKQLLLENVVIQVGTKETTHHIVEEMPRNETKFPEDEIMTMGGKPETIMPEDKKNSAVIRSSSSKAVVTAREPIDHKPSRSESDSCVANKSRRKVRSAATTTAISKTNDSSPKKKLRRNTGRVSNKNRPPLIEVGVRKTRSAAAAQSLFIEASERVVAEKIPKIEENVVFAEPAHPSSLATIDENGDFEHSDKIKELLQSMTENPTDLPPKHTGIRNLRLITNQQNQSNGGHGVRPSVAYILKTRKGFVRENKALFEGLAKDLREELDSSAVADTSRPHNGVNTPSITELYTLTTPKKKTSTVGKLSPPTSSRRRPGITTPRVSINNLRRSNGGTGSARKSLKRITNQNASTRKLSSRKYPSSPLAPPYNMKNRSKLSVLPDLRVTHV